MASLKDKIENAFNETRILVLGIQILIGFGFRTFFEPGFAGMTPTSQQLQLVALALMLMGFGVLMLPVPYHRIVLHGRNTAHLHRLATITVSAGLLPFALSMALSFYLAALWVLGTSGAATLAGGVLAFTLLCWYGVEFIGRSHRQQRFNLYAVVDPLKDTDMTAEHTTDLATRIKQVLIECRVVLPGAQALLGFQLIIMWMTEFYKMPQAWKLLHLASLTAVAISTILLITPAAYHRIVNQGEDSELLHHITERLLLAAMGFLAVGICGDFYVACRITNIGTAASTTLALVLLTFFYASWFGYTAWKRHTASDPELTASHLKGHSAA